MPSERNYTGRLKTMDYSYAITNLAKLLSFNRVTFMSSNRPTCENNNDKYVVASEKNWSGI